MPTQLEPHIYRIVLPIPSGSPRTVNIYAILKSEDSLIVDTGWPWQETRRVLLNELSRLPLKVKDIRKVLVTHFHPDHYGMAEELRQASDAEIFMNKIEAEIAVRRYGEAGEDTLTLFSMLRENGAPMEDAKKIFQASKNNLSGVKLLSKYTPVLDQKQISFSSDIKLEALLMPGHSPGHTCVYDKSSKVLLGGDLLLPSITSNIAKHPEYQGDPLHEYFLSLERLRKLDIRYLLPAHGDVIQDVKSRITEVSKHHLCRLQEILSNLTEEKSAYELALHMKWMNGGYETLPPLARWLAIMETLAHLEYLLIRGYVGKVRRYGVYIYERYHKIINGVPNLLGSYD